MRSNSPLAYSNHQYVLVFLGPEMYGLYSIAIPVYGFLFIPARIALSGDYKRFLERAAKIQAALLICVYTLSFAPALLDMDLVQYDAEGNATPWENGNPAGLLFYFLFIAQLGEESIKTGLPICYTSADSVFQVAAHEEHFGLENLYEYCQKVQEIVGPMNIGRVIARPFVGNNAEDFVRTGNRRDFSILPPEPTVLDKLKDSGGHVISIGKIADIYAQQGITEKTKATGIDALVDATIDHMRTAQDNSIIFTNLVNFDQDFGHRRDPVGFGLALESFDKQLDDVVNELKEDDVLFLIADHGCDPTWHGSDHTREYVPLIAYHKNIESVNLGERSTFADLGQTLADMFKLEPMNYGTSFLAKL